MMNKVSKFWRQDPMLTHPCLTRLTLTPALMETQETTLQRTFKLSKEAAKTFTEPQILSS